MSDAFQAQNGRCARCTAEIEIEPFTIEIVLGLNQRLAKMGQPEITKNECSLCDRCYPQWEQDRADLARRENNEVEYVCAMIRDGETVSVESWMWDDGDYERRIHDAQKARKRILEEEAKK